MQFTKQPNGQELLLDFIGLVMHGIPTLFSSLDSRKD